MYIGYQRLLLTTITKPSKAPMRVIEAEADENWMIGPTYFTTDLIRMEWWRGVSYGLVRRWDATHIQMRRLSAPLTPEGIRCLGAIVLRKRA